MNRLAVILFAIAVLLAHAIAIHQTDNGDYAAPYEFAHVGYRVARNVVREGSPAWNPGEALQETYPSPSWIFLAAIAERLTVGPNQLTQPAGTLAALATIVVLAQFSTKRRAGMIAPLLLAASGAAAAAGGSGTEAGFAMLLVTSAALASETGRSSLFGWAAALLVWTRPEAAAFLAAWFLLELFDRPRDLGGTRRGVLYGGFGAALGAWALLLFLRHLTTGRWFSTLLTQIAEADRPQLALGLDYLQGFLLCSGSGLLVLLPAAALLTGQLSGRGRRMLFLALFWACMVGACGGDPLPFWNALVPVLPLLFLSIQETIVGWVDRRPALGPVCWFVLLLGVIGSFLVSRLPADLGPFRFAALHRAWMKPEPSLVAAYGRSHGRLGLKQEIQEVERLRALGIYVRDRVQNPATLLTFWPGAIGYLSRRTVLDMLGRVTPVAGEERLRSWRGPKKVDLVEAFRQKADYAIPILGSLHEGMSLADMLHSWLERYDVVGDTPERLLELLSSLAEYELVAVPVPLDSKQPRITAEVPFLILRNRANQEAPAISIERHGDTFQVLVHHTGNQQVADLTVLAHCAEGTWTMRPTGEFVRERVVARSNLLLFSTGDLPIRLVESRIPAELHPLKLVAQLHNPGTSIDVPLALVGVPAVLDLGDGEEEIR